MFSSKICTENIDWISDWSCMTRTGIELLQEEYLGRFHVEYFGVKREIMKFCVIFSRFDLVRIMP